MTLPTIPQQWRLFSTLCTFVGPVTVADYGLGAVSDFRLNLRDHKVKEPPDPSLDLTDWFTADVLNGDAGLYVGPNGTVNPGGGVFLMAPAYLQGGRWFGGPDIGIIYISGPPADAGTPSVNQGTFRVMQGPAPDDLDLSAGVIHFYINDDGSVSIAAGEYS